MNDYDNMDNDIAKGIAAIRFGMTLVKMPALLFDFSGLLEFEYGWHWSEDHRRHYKEVQEEFSSE